MIIQAFHYAISISTPDRYYKKVDLDENQKKLSIALKTEEGQEIKVKELVRSFSSIT